MGKKKFFVGDEVWFTECGDLYTGFIVGFIEGWVNKGEFKFNTDRECVIDTNDEDGEYSYWSEEHLESIVTVPLDEVYYDN